ncbi:MAG: hypothetical protein HKO65_13060, partial [Gemmatimonadetes bacterium]|nr:hypothetical protein [Gemmatimonadota bacterium]
MGARARGAGRFFARLVLSIGVVGLLLLVLVTQTPAGKEWVLREALARVSGGIRGEIQINGVSSPGLLNGFTFRDVTIRGEDGSVFLRADSVRTGISGPALLRGDLILTGVRLWKPHLTLEKLSPDGALNAVAIFVGVDPPASRAQGVDSLPATVDSIAPEADSILERPANGSRRRIVLRDARVHDGTLDVFLP